MTPQTITTKQKEILALLYRFRFLNRTQIQTFLNHKDPKRINEWLKDLRIKEYVERIYDKDSRENTKPSVYYIGLNGIRYLKTLEFPGDQLKKLYRENERSESFIDQSLYVADICLDLGQKEEAIFIIITDSEYMSPDSPYYFLHENELDPNLVLEKEIKSGKKHLKKYYMLTVFEPTLPRYSIRKQIRSYFDFYFSNIWEENTKEDFPTLLFVCPSLSVLIFAKIFTKKLLDEYNDTDLQIKFTTKQEAVKIGIDSNIWES